MKKIHWTLLIFALLLTSSAFYVYRLYKPIPIQNTPGAPQGLVWIPPKSNAKQIIELLHEKKILEKPLEFKLMLKLQKKTKSLKPGEYLFSVPTPPQTIIDMLVNEKVVLHTFVIPEGYNLKEIAKTIQSAGLSSKEDLEKVFNDTSFKNELKVPGPSFEGFLFPDTYAFPKTASAEDLVRAMVKRFFSKITPEKKNQASRLGFSLLQWVTLASIIEKETGQDNEHPLVASVFHNRLKKKMKLQTDPTVIYGIENYDGNITRKHLLTPHPYNTYTHFGLPPGPIASPGLKALHAALNPEKTDFLYFVSRGDGTHVFSKDFKTHNEAVQNFQVKSN